MKIIPFTSDYIKATKVCADICIGENYFKEEDLKPFADKAVSFLLLDDNDEVQGFRLCYGPGDWLATKDQEKVSPQLWSIDQNHVAYFQSLFLSEKCQGAGWGVKLSQAAIESLKSLGAKAIVCHSWKESPHSSSMKYLLKLGFEKVIEYPNYWKEVDYHCVRCGKPCFCTATEMILYL